jgi:hypothetical protein
MRYTRPSRLSRLLVDAGLQHIVLSEAIDADPGRGNPSAAGFGGKSDLETAGTFQVPTALTQGVTGVAGRFSVRSL